MTLSPLGTATLLPITPAIAGTFGSWTINYTVGSYGIDSGGQIKIAMRIVCDWGTPQFDRPSDAGYTTVSTNGAAKIRASWQPRGYVRPKSKAIVLDIYDGSLSPGDRVTMVLGDQSQGSPGIRAQTYIESAFEFFVLVDPTNSTDPRPINDRLTLPVIADSAISLAGIIPSQGIVGRPVEAFVIGEDLWRNPVPQNDDLQFEWEGSADVLLKKNQITANSAGTGRLKVTAGDLVGYSNPIKFYPQLPEIRRYWGDLHAQTAGTVGVGTDDEYFLFGRDIARLDFTSHQGNDFQISDEYWAELNAITQKYHQDGSFVVFPGYEWSGSSPTGGDHNIFYRREGMPILRSSHWLVPHVPESELSPAHPADNFYAKLKQAVPLDDVIVCQHVGGRYANLLDYFDQDLIRLVEVVSVWGVFEWMLWDAFDKGYIVGVMANSDGHHGRPGAEGSGMTEFGIKNGLTCVLAPELTRDSIFDALKSRHCYATTGDRLLLDFQINGYLMGSVIDNPADKLAITASVIGTGPLESLQLYHGRNIIAEIRPKPFNQLTESSFIRVSWQGCRERGRQRRVTWDGQLRVSGCNILDVQPFSFDVVADGITNWSADRITFASKTTGDRDGLDIQLDDALSGTVVFDSAAGRAEINLAQLTDESPRMAIDFGGVDMQLIIERYPARVDTMTLALKHELETPARPLSPLFIKATQTDGQMAWASPIWIRRDSA